MSAPVILIFIAQASWLGCESGMSGSSFSRVVSENGSVVESNALAFTIASSSSSFCFPVA